MSFYAFIYLLLRTFAYRQHHTTGKMAIMAQHVL